MGRPPKEINAVRGERLKELLKDQKEQNKLSQTEIASRINLSQQVLSNIIHGKANLTDDTAKRIIEEFPEYSLFWLLGYDSPMYALDASQRVVDKVNALAQRLEKRRSAMLYIISELGYDIDQSGGKLTIESKAQKEKIILTEKEAREYYDELENMIGSFVSFHFNREKERSK